ncbi:MAG: PIG-L family deacetylase, partial [Desulfamplus sp.]|nr:PIG-L family deacetylase [Desulfamplus sp.]
IQLKGHRVLFKDQPIEVILFRNQEITNSKILIIAPHPDDAEIAAFGLYSGQGYYSGSSPSNRSLQSRGNNQKNIYIVTVTAGDAGTYQYDEIYSNRRNHFLKKGRLRTWNSITVPLLGGVPPENILNLGFFDGTLQKMFDVNPETVKSLYTGISNVKIFRRQNISPLANILEGEANWDSLVTNLENLLNTIEPDIIVAPYPALDRHPDHKFSSIALFEAIKRAAISNKNRQYKIDVENTDYAADKNYERHDNYAKHENSNYEDDAHYDIRRGFLYLYTNHFVLNEYYPYGKMGAVISPPPVFEKTIYFKSIYSHLLSPDRQREKILSLEAMNDLRPDTSWRFSGDALNMAFASIKRDIMGKNVSYYRRAIRNNELFFVVPVSDIYNQSVLNRIVGAIE